MIKTVSKNYLTRTSKIIETKNLKKYRKSTAWISILNGLYPCINIVDIVSGDMDIDTVIKDITALYNNILNNNGYKVYVGFTGEKFWLFSDSEKDLQMQHKKYWDNCIYGASELCRALAKYITATDLSAKWVITASFGIT